MEKKVLYRVQFLEGFVKNRWLTGRGTGGYSGAMEMLDAPEIRRMERWGALKPLEEPRCPVCGETCEWIYIWKEREIVGCENCVRRCDALSKGEEECGRIRWIGC